MRSFFLKGMQEVPEEISMEIVGNTTRMKDQKIMVRISMCTRVEGGIVSGELLIPEEVRDIAELDTLQER